MASLTARADLSRYGIIVGCEPATQSSRCCYIVTVSFTYRIAFNIAMFDVPNPATRRSVVLQDIHINGHTKVATP